MSNDASEAITIIAFVGSVFSPYYAYRRRRNIADPANHVAINAALYPSAGRDRWVMTERGKSMLKLDAHRYELAASALQWHNGELLVTLQERDTLGRPLRGNLRVRPLFHQHTAWDLSGGNIWHPYAPLCDLEINLTDPAWKWQGRGYLDHNRGPVCLEHTFSNWHWSRRHLGTAGMDIEYNISLNNGLRRNLVVHCDANGHMTEQPAAAEYPLSKTKWLIARTTQFGPASIRRTLEDTPFYARSLLSSERGPVFHESLNLERFKKPWVQALLPFRTPRRG